MDDFVAAQPDTVLLDEAVPFSRSHLWTLQRAYFERRGCEAWQPGEVPWFITSNPVVASAYVRIVAGFLRDGVASGAIDPSKPIFIVELGSGSGRFAFHFLQAWLRRAASCAGQPEIRFVLTDLAERSLDFLAGHPRLAPFFESGILDIARFDVERDRELALRRAGIVLSRTTCTNPLIVIANYVFDGLAHDAYYVSRGKLHESLVSLSVSGPVSDRNDPALLSKVELRFDHRAIDESAPRGGHDPLRDVLLEEYRCSLVDSAVLIPSGALAFLANLGEISGGRAFVLCADWGVAGEAELSGFDPADLGRHGSVSLPVNYHALGRYVELLGGTSLLPAHHHAQLCVAAFVFGPFGEGEATRAAYADATGPHAPDDFYVLHKALERALPGLELDELLAFVRFGAHDPRVLQKVHDGLLVAATNSTPAQRREIRRIIHQVWDARYELPGDPDLALLLGALASAAGLHLDAIEFLGASLDARGPAVEALALLALSELSLQRIDAAREHADMALALAPDSRQVRALRGRIAPEVDGRSVEPGAPIAGEELPGAGTGLSPVECLARGVQAAERGSVDDAVLWCERALELAPAFVEAHVNLGVIAVQSGDVEESIRRFSLASAIEPENRVASHNLEMALTLRAGAASARGAHEDARRMFKEAILRAPRSAEAWYGLGVAYAELGDRAHATVCYEIAALADPEHAEALNNLGVILQDLGQHSRAAQCFEVASRLRPTSPDPASNLGTLRLLCQGYDEARVALERAVALDSTHASAWNNIGLIAQDMGDVRKALRCYFRAARSKPAVRAMQHNILRAACFLPGISTARVAKLHTDWGKRFQAAVTPLPRPEARSLDPDRPLRVGYLSPDLRIHSVSYFLEGILAHHSSAVTTYCYSASPTMDEKTLHFQHCAQQWRSVDGLSAHDVAAAVRSDEIDLLVDLAGHTAGNRLDVMALRPAPVQLTYLGYPNTTGLPTIDYRLTDSCCDPPGEPWFGSEELVRLPGCFVCYTPSGSLPDVAPLPQTTRGYTTFASFNDLAKVSDPVLAAWARILTTLTDARLLLKAKAFASQIATERVQTRLAALGIARERVECRPHAPSVHGHLATYAEADIALDTFPYSGTTTTCEALLMGVPVITLRGHCHAQNVTSSLVSAAGHPEFVARSLDEYVTHACALAADGARLCALRGSLRPRLLASPLCDARSFTRALEDQYRRIWQRHCAASTPSPKGLNSLYAVGRPNNTPGLIKAQATIP